MRYSLKQLQGEALDIAGKVNAGRTDPIPGWDFEDLAQEALMVMWLAIATGRVRSHGAVVHTGWNVIRKIARDSRAECRCPQNAFGAPLALIPFHDSLSPSYRTVYDMSLDTPVAAIPPCHVRGEDPEGYDREDALCHNCPDKFSCLVETEQTDLVAARVVDDPEVLFVVKAKKDSARLRLAHEIVTERQRRRVRCRALKLPVSPELAVDAPIILPPAPEPVPARQRRAGASLGAPAPREPMTEPAKMPRVRHLSPAAMDLAMSRIRIGQPFSLEIGHVLVRRREGPGPDTCVELREDGFWLNLNGRTYGSLSTAAKAASCMFGGSYKANRPGNAFFNIARCSNTEIRDAASGAVLACRRRGRA